MRRVIVRGILARKLRLALTAISISLGVAFVSATFVLGDTMTATFDQLYEGLTEGTDVTVRAGSSFVDTSTLGDTRPFPVAVLDEVAAVDGVAAASGSVTGYALIVDETGEPVQPGGAPTLGASYEPAPPWPAASRCAPAPRRPGPARWCWTPAPRRGRGTSPATR